MRSRSRRTDRLEIGKSADCVGERVVFSRLRVDSGDLVDAEAQSVGLLREFTMVGAPRVEFVENRDPALARRAIPLQRRGRLVPGETVEGVTLMVGTKQAQLVVLAVNRQQRTREPAHHTDRHRPPAEVRARTTIGSDGADRDDRAVVIEFCTCGFDDVGDGGTSGGVGGLSESEPPFDGGLLASRTHSPGVGTCARE